MVVVAPLDEQLAAVQHQGRSAIRQITASGGDQSCAGAGAAGPGQARAAFPNAKADAVTAENLGEADVDLLRKKQVVLDRQPGRGDGRSFDIGDEEHDVRIAHGNARRRAYKRGVCKERHVQRTGILRLGQRDLAPIEPRLSHIDTYQPLASPAGEKAAGLGFDHRLVLA